MTLAKTTVTVDGMIDWLTATVARYAELPENEIDPDQPLSEYGLDSVSAFAVITEIEDTFDVVPDVTVVWDHPTVRALASFLVGFIHSEHQ